ncbi:MAG: ABC transporter ATP-binding protein [Caldilineaceae bacterium SB0664_bin_27]|uniref:ABC transporter ATP-binding protein n=1 Tax=Caldilineaceae bacterium SB0664_bin_27 TaxID=2605260 RepID=A0A6B0YUT0_9CHLR|nr:ABC transporter ATP-binding protein [Caldilineaceae bacterium SB0664_bin_27]
MEHKHSVEPIVRVKNLTKIYGSGETAVRALDGLSVEVQTGEFVAVMGPSGCGKSTLLNMLGALDQPTEGTVWVAGEDLSKLKDVDRFRARTVGFVFQLHNLLPTMTAQENVEVPLQGQIGSRKERKERAVHLMELVGLADRRNHLPGQLSGGQRQRVAIARSLANSPSLILADEPSGALDSQSSDEILTLLAELNSSQGTSIVVVTHDRRVAQATQRILRMQDGKVVSDHRITDPLEEDLRMFAQSQFGQTLLESSRTLHRFVEEQDLAALRQLLLTYDDGAEESGETEAPSSEA